MTSILPSSNVQPLAPGPAFGLNLASIPASLSDHVLVQAAEVIPTEDGTLLFLGPRPRGSGRSPMAFMTCGNRLKGVRDLRRIDAWELDVRVGTTVPVPEGGVVVARIARMGPFVLVQGLYKGQAPAREAELAEARRRNLSNPWIGEVRFVLEDEAARATPELSNPKARLFDLGRRATYEDLFGVANRDREGLTIVANADIWFDDSVRFVIPGNDEILASAHGCSQDAWFFRSPLRSFPCAQWLGKGGCEYRLAWEARNVGIGVFRIETKSMHHEHKTGLRNHWPRADEKGMPLYFPPGKGGLGKSDLVLTRNRNVFTLNSTKGSKVFNNGIARFDGRTYMTFRRCPYIWITELDDEFRPINPRVLLEHAQDARLFVLNGQLHCSYTSSVDTNDLHMRVCRLGSNLEITFERCLFKRKPIEKNWQFFQNKEETYCVYGYNPFTIFRFDSEFELLEEIRGKKVEWPHGEVRGNTPPFIHDGLFHMLVHSLTGHKTYANGILKFDEDFNVRSIALLYIDDHNIVFPCGFIPYKDGFAISYGYADSYAKIKVVSRDELAEAIKQ